jgi:pilus assembly protein Flp/PilA
MVKARMQDLVARARERRGRDERGASLVEYALLVALIALVCIGAVTMLGENGSDKLDEAAVAVGGEAEDGPDDGCPSSNPYAVNAGWCTSIPPALWLSPSDPGGDGSEAYARVP